MAFQASQHVEEHSQTNRDWGIKQGMKHLVVRELVI